MPNIIWLLMHILTSQLNLIILVVDTPIHRRFPLTDVGVPNTLVLARLLLRSFWQTPGLNRGQYPPSSVIQCFARALLDMWQILRFPITTHNLNQASHGLFVSAGTKTQRLRPNLTKETAPEAWHLRESDLRSQSSCSPWT